MFGSERLWDPNLYHWPILAFPSKSSKVHFPALELITHRHQSYVRFSQLLKGFPFCPVRSNHCRSLCLNQNLKCAIIPYECFFIHFPLALKLLFDIALSKAWFNIGFNCGSCLSIKIFPFYVCLTWFYWGPQLPSFALRHLNLYLFLHSSLLWEKQPCYSPENNSSLISFLPREI